MVLVILLMVFGLMITLVRGERARRRPLSGAELLRRAERKLEADRRRTRRAMNDAAGQSWRNMVD